MYTETQLAQLIETVEKEFTTHLNKAETLAKSENSNAPLAKAEDSQPPKKEEKKDDKPSEGKEAAPEKKDAAPAAPAEGEEAAPAAPAAPAEGEAAPAAPAAMDAAPQGDACDYDAEDLAHMDKMYASMSKGELLAHHDAVRKALDAQSAQAPAAAAPAPEAAAPAAPAPMMGKSEKPGHSELKDENPELNSKATAKGSNTNAAYNKNSGGAQSATGEPNGSPGAKSPASTDQRNLDNMEKSEVEALKGQNADLKKSLDTATEFLAKLVGKIGAPKGKAVTEIAALQKSEGSSEGTEMSKAEVTQVLLRKSQDPSLTKSDREAINAYYLNNANYNTISHLLK